MDGDVELTIYYDSVNNMVIIHDVNKSDDILLVTYSFDTKKRDENVIEYSRVVEGMPVVWSFKNNLLKTNEQFNGNTYIFNCRCFYFIERDMMSKFKLVKKGR